MMIVFNPGVNGHDDGRYYSIAWETYAHQHILFPYLNGALYLDKPGLFFWLVAGAWQLFGVHAWVPQLINVMSFIGTFLLMRASSPYLKLEDQALSAIKLLLGCFFIYNFLYVFRFDLFVMLWSTLAIYALCRSLKTQRLSITLLTVAIAGGTLTKGPVIFVYILPFAVCLPFIYQFKHKGRFFSAVIASCLLGCLPILAWVAYGYHVYGDKLLHYLIYNQTINRVTSMGKRSFFWYWYSLLFWLLPWTLCLAFWQSLKSIKRCWRQPSYRLLTYGFFFSLILFSLFAQKEPRYMLPLLPMVMLLIGMQLQTHFRDRGPLRWQHCLLPLILIFAFAIILLVVHGQTGLVQSKALKKEYWIITVPAFAALLTMLVGSAMLVLLITWRKSLTLQRMLMYYAASGIAIYIIILGALIPASKTFYNYQGFANLIHTKQTAGYRVFINSYKGDLNYIGRLQQPIYDMNTLKTYQGKACVIVDGANLSHWPAVKWQRAGWHYNFFSIKKRWLLCR